VGSLKFAAANWVDIDASRRKFAAANFPSGPPLSDPKRLTTKAGTPGLRRIWSIQQVTILDPPATSPGSSIQEVRAMQAQK
jgi:hypothetical protein